MMTPDIPVFPFDSCQQNTADINGVLLLLVVTTVQQ